jgi:hypothetical protein
LAPLPNIYIVVNEIKRLYTNVYTAFVNANVGNQGRIFTQATLALLFSQLSFVYVFKANQERNIFVTKNKKRKMKRKRKQRN